MTYATLARRWGTNVPGFPRPEPASDVAPRPGALDTRLRALATEPVLALERELAEFVEAVGGTRYRPL